MRRSVGRCKMVWVSLLVSAGAFGFPAALLACSCISPETPQDAVKDAKAVFLGLVEKFEATGEPLVTRPPQALDDYGLTTPYGRDRQIVALFRILRTWKGPQQPSLAVLTGAGGGDCGYDFQVGEVYLVYAYRDNADGLATGICSRTKPAWKTQDVEEDLKALGPGTPIADSSAQSPQ